jgi:hypothetical protein
MSPLKGEIICIDVIESYDDIDTAICADIFVYEIDVCCLWTPSNQDRNHDAVNIGAPAGARF